MKTKLIIVLCVLLVLTAIVLAASNLYSKYKSESDPAASYSDCLRSVLKGQDGVSITVGTIKDGKTDWTVYGKDGKVLPKELHTYEIGSITKTVTAALASRAVSEGLINIDDEINIYLDLPEGKAYPTIRQLLTHTAGYKSFYYNRLMPGNVLSGRSATYGITGDMLLDKAAKLNTPEREQAFSYSNFGFCMLAMILENVYGEKYTVLANELLRETGMVNSHISTGEGDLGDYYDWKADDGYIPAGAIVSDIEDMLLYAQKQLDNEGVFALTHETLSDVTTVTTKNRLLTSFGIDEIGMSWFKDTENGFIWHAGDTENYYAYLGFCPETKTAVVVLSKMSSSLLASAEPTLLGTKLLKELQSTGA